MQFEDKKTGRKRVSCITDAEHIAGEEGENDSDTPDGGRIQDLGVTGVKNPEDNEQSRLTASLKPVNNTEDSKHSVSDGLPAKKVEKGSN